MRTTLALLGAVVLLVLAGLAALLAADARGWQRTIRSDDALLASTPAAARWQPPTHLGSVSERLLGLRDDLQLRRAIALYLRTIKIPVRLDNAQSLAVARGRAEQALAAVARNASGRRASQAATLLGVLVFTDVGPSADPFHPTTGTDLDQAQASLTDFEDAVRADPRERGRQVRPRAGAADPRRAGSPRGRGTADRRRIDRPARRRRRRRGRRLLMLASLVFLTPTAGVVALAVLLPIVAFLVAERRVERVRNVLLLEAPRGGLDLIVLAALAAAVLVLALAAAQPALADRSTQRVRTDAQVLFVVDTSASMAASSGAAGRTRLSRATAAAARLRAAIPDVPSGVATLTDRVLPNLLPAPDAAAFDATLNQAVAINEPPPRELNPRATTFGALAAVPGAGYFEPSAKHRAVVLLTDGESTYFDAGNVGRAFAAKPRTGLLAVRFWRGDEAIYAPSGKIGSELPAGREREGPARIARRRHRRKGGRGRRARIRRLVASLAAGDRPDPGGRPHAEDASPRALRRPAGAPAAATRLQAQAPTRLRTGRRGEAEASPLPGRFATCRRPRPSCRRRRDPRPCTGRRSCPS